MRTHDSSSRARNVSLWTVQGVLCALFLFAGGLKLVMPVAALTQQTGIPGAFLRFIGICEALGALGLVLPGLFHVREDLTPLAAAGLVIIMSGAVGATLAAGPAGPAVVPLVVGGFAGFVAYGRSRTTPERRTRRGTGRATPRPPVRVGVPQPGH